MRRIIATIAAILITTAALFAETKAAHTQVYTNHDEKNWVIYYDDITEIFSIDKALEYAQKEPPLDGYILDCMYIENISVWGFSPLIEKVLREHSYILVQNNNNTMVEFYQIGSNEMLMALYKAK